MIFNFLITYSFRGLRRGMLEATTLTPTKIFLGVTDP